MNFEFIKISYDCSYSLVPNSNQELLKTEWAYLEKIELKDGKSTKSVKYFKIGEANKIAAHLKSLGFCYLKIPLKRFLLDLNILIWKVEITKKDYSKRKRFGRFN